ncbi:hypothetical protein D9M68_520770 [compost metagenome]
MKNRLIALLKALFANKGFNAKELESLADLVIAQNLLTEESTDQDLQTASEAAKPIADFVQSVASRQVSDVKKPKVEEPKPADPAIPNEPVKTDDMPEWAKALVASTQALAQGLQSLQTEKTANTRREQYAKTLDGTSDAYKAKALKDFDRLSFKDDEDFSSWLTESEEEIKAFKQDEVNQTLAGGGRPAGGDGKPVGGKKLASESELDAVMENL